MTAPTGIDMEARETRQWVAMVEAEPHDFTAQERIVAGRMRKLFYALAKSNALAASQAEQIAGMRRALEPFAKKSGWLPRSWGDQRIVDDLDFTAGDLRAAKAAYDATQRKPTDAAS